MNSSGGQGSRGGGGGGGRGQGRGGVNNRGGGHHHSHHHSQQNHGRKNSNASSTGSSSGAAASSNHTPQISQSQQQQQQPSPSPIQLSSLLGTELALVLSTGNGPNAGSKTVTGNLWCYDPSFGSLVLSSPDSTTSSFHIIRLNSIASITVTSTTPPSTATTFDLPALSNVPISSVKQKEQEALIKESKRLARLPPPGVSDLGAELFEALGKTLPVRWAGTTIVVLDEVLIPPPYEPSLCQSANQNRLDRVQKVLQGEREKLQRTRHELFNEAAR